ncbi:U-box domain-containing protein 45 [Typha latifolia]|uniref:U-box domain-containing protein 45 n=1 Tax=Typha latifolia TaxID=4733 RepID=UPI003C2D2AB3
MAKCQRGDYAGFRLWPLFSAASFRRKLLEALTCGVSRQRRKSSAAAAFESPKPRPRSDRLVELLRAEVSESGSDEAEEEGEGEAEAQRKTEAFEELQRVVRWLDLDDNGGDRRRDGATEIRRLTKDDAEARETLAMLGAIPPLVGMLGYDDLELQIPALYALLNLGIGNDMNKAAIVKAGAVHKMLDLIESRSPPSVSEAIVANFLSLSALDSNKSIIGSSGVIPFLVNSFQNPNPSSRQSRQDALRALFNLSIAASNAPHLVESGLVTAILAAIGDMDVTDRSLAALSNLVASPEGRRAVIRSKDALAILVDVLHWSDAPGCQEKAVYILMVMAHKAGYGERTAMVEAGIVSALLELTLLGSPLAQKRASRVLEILRVDKGKQVEDGSGFCCSVPAVSAPLSIAEGKEEEEEERDEMGMSDEKKAVNQLVQQSLQSNMRRIVKRANLPQEFAPSEHFKALTVSSTSKSLPF